ncbi:MAG: hypothetical protein ACP5NF_11670, partial [Thermoanaerobaculum sp.]
MRFRVSYLLLSLAAFQGIAPHLSGQSCFSTVGRFYDDCNDSSGFYPPKAAELQVVGSKRLMYINTNFQVRVFDLTNADLPAPVATLTMPFPPGCGLPFGCSDNHFQYEDTVWPVSAVSLGNVGYAFVPLDDYGWDMIKASAAPTLQVSFMGTGYHPPGNGGPYRSGALFLHNGSVYLVGQMLDPASVSAGDKSVRIYNLGATPPANLYDSLGPGVRVPLGGAGDPPGYAALTLNMGSHFFYVRDVGVKRVLFIYTPTTPPSGSWLAAFDITDPSSPQPAGLWPYSTDPTLFPAIGQVEFEEGASRLWVVKVQMGTAASVTITGYNLTWAGSGVSLDQVSTGTWPLGSASGGTKPVVSAGLGLLVMGFMQVGKAFAISPSGTLTPLPDTPGYTDLSVNLEEPCQYWDLARGFMGLKVFDGASGDIYFYRSAMKEGRTIKVAASCLALAPTAQLAVQNTAPTEAQAASCGAADADGFPGDSFVFQDTSVGQITYKTLKVCPGSAGCATPVYQATWTQSGGWQPGLTWQSDAASTGLFVATLTVGNGQDPDSSVSRTIQLCANPQAALEPAGGSFLQNTQVTLSGSATSGHPTSYDFAIWSPGDSQPTLFPSTTPSHALTLSQCGTYKAALVAHYPHAGTDSGCGSWYTDSNPTTYDSCTAPANFVAGAALVTIAVKQGGKDTDFPLVGQDTVVQFTGQVASGYTATYAWSATANNQPVTVSGLSDCTSATCTIPANTLQAGVTYAFSLQVGLSPDPGGCAPGPVSKTVTPISATATMQIQNTSGQPITQAAVGQTVRLKVTSYQNLALNELKFRLVGNQSCDDRIEFAICNFGLCVDYQDVSFKNEGSVTVQLVWNPQAGEQVMDPQASEQVMDTKSLTLTPGSCPTNCTFDISPNRASFGASGGSGSFSVTTASGCPWQAVPDVPWIQITSGSRGVGSGSVSYSVEANSGGPRQGKIRVPDASSNVS